VQAVWYRPISWLIFDSRWTSPSRSTVFLSWYGLRDIEFSWCYLGGGDRSRRRRWPRCPGGTTAGLSPSAGWACCLPWWSAAPIDGRRTRRRPASAGALTIASNSASSHSSSSQTNAQNCASTAPEPSTWPVPWRPFVTRLTPCRSSTRTARCMSAGV